MPTSASVSDLGAGIDEAQSVDINVLADLGMLAPKVFLQGRP